MEQQMKVNIFEIVLELQCCNHAEKSHFGNIVGTDVLYGNHADVGVGSDIGNY